jgi:hypothetical protein
MTLVLAVPALDACAPSGTPALACLSESLRARLPFVDHGESRAALVNPPLPLHDPRKLHAPAAADVPADTPIVPPASPEMLKVDLPVLSPIGEARAATPTTQLVRTEETIVPEVAVVPSVATAPTQPIPSPATPAPDLPIVPAVDPVTANAVPLEPATEIANVTSDLPVTLPPNPKPPMPEPLAAASPTPDTAPAPVQPPATEAALLPPTIDTIQIGGTDNFVAGDAPEGSMVRLYLDDQPAGESDVQDGRWLVEGVELSTAPQQILKVEAIDIASGKVLGTGAISVEIELPDDEQLPPVDDERDPPSFTDETVPAVPDAPAAAPEEAPAPKPVSQLAAPAVAAAEPAVAPKPLPPLAPVTPRRASASVELLSPVDGGSIVTLGR